MVERPKTGYRRYGSYTRGRSIVALIICSLLFILVRDGHAAWLQSERGPSEDPRGKQTKIEQKKAVEPDGSWHITLEARVAGTVDASRLSLGTTPTAGAGLDGEDIPQAPGFPDREVDLYTEHQQVEPGWEGQVHAVEHYRRQVDPPLTGSGRRIDFRVAANPGGTVVLTWKGLEDADLAGYTIELVDETSGKRIDMRGAPSTEWLMTAGLRRMAVELTPGGGAAPVAGFTVNGPERNLARWENTISLSTMGAEVIDYSSGTGIGNLIDGDENTAWRSARGHRKNQWVTMRLSRGRSRRFDRIRVINMGQRESMKRFEVWVSTTTPEASSFQKVLMETAGPTRSMREYRLGHAVEARYVQLKILDNWGDPDYVRVGEFELVDGSAAGVEKGVRTPENVAAASEGAEVVSVTSQESLGKNLIDGQVGTYWESAVGSIGNETVVIDLAREGAWPLTGIRLWNGDGVHAKRGVRGFRLEVSATTPDAGAFVPVLTGMATTGTSVQEFKIPGGPVKARYMRLIMVDNWGGTQVAVREIEGVAAEPEGASYSSYDASAYGGYGRPEWMRAVIGVRDGGRRGTHQATNG